jgi:hypothetical protein
MPEGRVSGRSAATSIDGAEHGGMLLVPVAVRQERAPPHTTRRHPIADCRGFEGLR